MKLPQRDSSIVIGKPWKENSFRAIVLESKETERGEIIANILYLQNGSKVTSDWAVWRSDHWDFRSEGITGITVGEPESTFQARLARADRWSPEN